ncbi:uncharacterized protein CTRU02_213138 [Colletotrichum truncatum]|uniref:Uncharacterized protein n=1 Tax=Colletotrichum truncatum TaxID=5467 RepID=A0ACC3YJW0_COLTU|nr:uncharacterized protein CTRU02_03458 [Colletotrichum truncatum]KAF6797427.1 hypothetical protein CTRU02_03458 [Colletotrichum truncatum]
MGYSEIECYLCGVSFKIGRLRTMEEVQTPLDLPPSMLVNMDIYIKNASWSIIQRCEDVEGCRSRKYTLPGGTGEMDEHIAGPACGHTGGYHGRFISVQEMHGCCTAQALVPKPDDWEPEEDDDDDIEQDGFFLTGLCDDIPSPDLDDMDTFPERHDCHEPQVCNFYHDDQMERAAMAFHPACLEVFKRASLRRFGSIDVQGLMEWFRLDAAWSTHNPVSHSAAVNRGRDQWFRHVVGDEFLAANPCFVPRLQHILRAHTGQAEDTDIGQDASQDDASPPPSSPNQDPFTTLPYELLTQILFELEPSEAVNLLEASSVLRAFPQTFFRELLLRQKPWIWEAWCDLPYSYWTTTTETALRRQDEKWQKAAQDFEKTFKDGFAELYNLPDEYLESTRTLEHQLKEKYGELCRKLFEREKYVEVPVLSPTQTDWYGIYVETEKQHQKMLGIRNRERIWKDCEEILDRIEKYRKDGKIRSFDEIMEERMARLARLETSDDSDDDDDDNGDESGENGESDENDDSNGSGSGEE